MVTPFSAREQFHLVLYFIRWLAISFVVALLSGSASAFFLKSLDWATALRQNNHFLIACLPLAGLVMGWFYHRLGQSVEKGNNLLIDEIHNPKSAIPLRMAPLIFVSTVATHLFGGSAGREGTAVQMGGSLSDQLTKIFRFNEQDRRIVLMAGISAGFASVFGTPLAGAIFGLEVLMLGRMQYDAIFPCLVSAILADEVTRAWGVSHQIYHASLPAALTVDVFFGVIAASIIFGFAGMLFAASIHQTSKFFNKYIVYSPLKLFVGGALVAGIVMTTGCYGSIGLGIEGISASFQKTVPVFDFLVKWIMTALTLGSGFKGGEVTPLFYIGSTLGNSLSHILTMLPVSFLAALGFVAVFAGAANTPICCTLLAMEIFGAEIGIYAALACVVSYLFSGHAGIYSSQKIETRKLKT